MCLCLLLRMTPLFMLPACAFAVELLSPNAALVFPAFKGLLSINPKKYHRKGFLLPKNTFIAEAISFSVFFFISDRP
ncbi:hypothetical protein F4678DRAFT_442691 [Xylaria arbuscula]|nr:hypothetical protein F4678DRAFT_442691 [Xylaria arbuscula]